MAPIHLPSLTTAELINVLLTDGTLTDREAILLERLQSALDEIDALDEELKRADTRE